MGTKIAVPLRRRSEPLRPFLMIRSLTMFSASRLAAFTASLLMSTSLSIFAQPVEKMARIELAGKTSQPVEFEIDKVSDDARSSVSGWAKKAEDERRFFTLEFPADRDWREGSVTFKALQTGRAALVLMGPYVLVDDGTKELKPVFIEFDDFTSEEIPLQNGSFEDVLISGAVNGWSRSTNENSNPPIDETSIAQPVSGDAPDGAKHVRVWHNSNFAQTFPVTEGQLVTVKFYYRLGL